MIKTFFYKYFELAFWICGLVCLAFINPSAQAHFSLCPLKMLGFSWCPGCGLGHAISFLFHGDISASFHAHWLGVPTLFIILYRVFSLLRMRFFIRPFTSPAVNNPFEQLPANSKQPV